MLKMTEKKENIIIRTAKITDAEELLKIYAPYVEKTAITFEYEVPKLEEFKNRMENTLKDILIFLRKKTGRFLAMPIPVPL